MMKNESKELVLSCCDWEFFCCAVVFLDSHCFQFSVSFSFIFAFFIFVFIHWMGKKKNQFLDFIAKNKSKKTLLGLK